MSSGGDIDIYVRMSVEDNLSPQLRNVTRELYETQEAAKGTSQAMGEITVPMGETEKSLKRGSDATYHWLTPTRGLSRDIWGLGYSFSRLNHILGQNNQIFQMVVNTFIVFGAVLRVLAILESMPYWMDRLGQSTLFATLMQKAFNAELTKTAILEAAVSGGTTLPAQLAGGAAMTAFLHGGALGVPTFQKGGTIPYTGLFMLHRGERVIPSGGPDMSWVTINMTTGPLSSSVDVDNMMDVMASRMSLESRRRRR